MKTWARLAPAILAVSLLATACTGSSGATAPTTVPKAAPTSAPAATTAPAANTGAAATPAVNSGAPAKVTTLRLGHIANPDQAVGKATLEFARLVGEKSKGELKVEVFPSSQLGGADQLHEKVRVGSLEMALLSVANLGDTNNQYMIVETPFVWASQDHLRKVMDGKIGSGMAEKYKATAKATILSQAWDRSARELMTVKPINSVADVQGLKLRIPNDPVYTAAWQLLGAKPTSMALTEVYTSIQQKVVDGVEVPVDYMVSNSFYQVAKNLTMIDYIRGTQAIVINDKLYSGLPKNLQDALVSAAAEAAKINNDLTVKSVESDIKKMTDGGAVMSKPDLAPWMEKVKPVYAQFESKWGKGLYEDIQAAK